MKTIAIKYGILMLVGFIAYFLFMNILNLSTNYNFRVLNGAFHIICIYLAIKTYSKSYPDEFNYLSGTAMGIYTSMIGVIPFAAFQLIFLSYDEKLMAHLVANVSYVGEYLTPYTAALIILMEGLAVSIVVSYIIMRLVESFKTKNVEYSRR